jgi:hypothetical protein
MFNGILSSKIRHDTIAAEFAAAVDAVHFEGHGR